MARPVRPTRVVFCNELLDAMPVHRIGWDATKGEWFEWGVSAADGQFVWTRLSQATAGIEIPVLPPALLAVLPDGFTTEVCPVAVRWWRKAAELPGTHWMMAFDYGLEADERFVPERVAGTLRGYRAHQVVQDVLACPGDQDITAHVNFTELQASGESAGLVTDTFSTQAQFLTCLAADAWKDPGFADWTSKQTRQFQTLTHPEHLGRAFKVLVQRRPSA